MKARLRQGRKEEIGPCQTPGYLALCSGGYPCCKKRSRSAVDSPRPAACDLVQRAMGQAAARKDAIDLRHAERQTAR